MQRPAAARRKRLYRPRLDAILRKHFECWLLLKRTSALQDAFDGLTWLL